MSFTGTPDLVENNELKKTADFIVHSIIKAISENK